MLMGNHRVGRARPLRCSKKGSAYPGCSLFLPSYNNSRRAFFLRGGCTLHRGSVGDDNALVLRVEAAQAGAGDNTHRGTGPLGLNAVV